MLYTVPTPDTTTYQHLRALRPQDVIPLPGEPIVAGRTHGSLRVWASDGTRHGWYNVTGDTFDPVIGQG